MILYYEHHHASDGSVIATDVAASSVSGRTSINWRNVNEKTMFDIVRAMFKSIPLEYRSYDEKTKLWSFIGSNGHDVMQQIEKAFATSAHMPRYIEIESLASHITTGSIPVPSGASQKYDPKKFFYDSTPAPKAAPTKQSVQAQLSTLLSVSEAELSVADAGILKQLYRKAALRFHPDRNNGDGSQMSTLNSLWSVYNA